MLNILKLFVLALLFSTNIYAVSPGGMVANYYNFPIKKGGYDEMKADFQITHEPGHDGLTFWANQFQFEKVEGGYTGLQQNDGRTKKAIFSIWNAKGWNKIKGAECSYFSHEGSGVSCLIDYSWKEGQRYQFVWSRVGQNEKEQVWQSRVIDLSTDKATVIGEIRIPKSWGGLKPELTQFVENYAQAEQEYRQCSEVPATTNIFFKPSANGVKAISASTEIYGACSRVAESFCTLEGDCISTINSKSYIKQPAFMLKNGVLGFCADSLASGNKMGLYVCQFNHNQKMQISGTHQLKLVEQSMCLGVDKEKSVVAEPCNQSGNQRWLSIPSRHQYLHVATGQCMDAVNGGKISTNIKVQPCVAKRTQSWKIIRERF